MCRLFETIRIVNGVPQHLPWHALRMNLALNELWRRHEPFSLDPFPDIAPGYSEGVVRCNIQYGPGILEITFSRYEKRPVGSLKLVECNRIDYHLKYSDRTVLKQLMDLRGECDDILIVKNGFITDTSFANIIFDDGTGWVTPAKPLLKGTCRERLLAGGELAERDIRPEDIPGYRGFKIINAMRQPGEEMRVPVSRISH